MEFATTGKWLGIVTGTNRGVIIVDFTESEGQVTGQATLADAQYGESKFRLSGPRTNSHLSLVLSDFQSSVSATPSSGKAELDLTASDEIQGKWETDSGTRGTLAAIRASAGTTGAASVLTPAPAATTPNSYVSQEVNLPACRLDRTAFVGLVEIATRGLAATPTIQTKVGGQFVRKVGVEIFLNDATLPGQINNVQVYAAEVHRTVTLTLSDYQRSTAVVWSNDPTWAEGKAQEILHYVEGRRARGNDLYRRYSGWLGPVALALMLIVLPTVSHLSGRAVLVVSTFVVILGLGRLYQKVLPATTVLLRESASARSSLVLEKLIPSVATALAFGALAYVWNLVTPYLSNVETWLSNSFR
jgi:hypothetical protein